MSDAIDDEADDASADDEEILKEAKKRFEWCETWEATARNMFVDDMKFGHADSDNMYQWPNAMLASRQLNQSSTLTINKVRQCCLQIINDQKQNKSRIAVHPTTNEATFEAAQVYEDVVRHIEYQSRAEAAYDKASENQVYGGVGYCRAVTEYVAEDSFDQDILIRPVPDPLTVYMDPDAKEADKSDSNFAFVFDDMARDRFKQAYPDVPLIGSVAPIGSGYDGWTSEHTVRVAEYWRRRFEKKTLISYIDEAGDRVSVLEEKLPANVAEPLKKSPAYRRREVEVATVECFKIAANTIVDRYTWLGQWIPIVPAVGEETVIDGQMDRKGHVRYLKDAQRMYNYYASSAADSVGLQTKTPYVGPAKAFEGFEEYWAQANVQNLAFLPYNHIDDQKTAIPAPTREQPPVMPSATIEGMQISEQQLMMASGQYQSQFGEKENATSGKAISERQRQGDNATYHFIDNHAAMVRQLGRIVVDLIPKIYDTKRIMRIRGDDGIVKNITIDPKASGAVQQIKHDDRDEVDIIFNPNIGRYAVEADVGPNYATKRQEAWNAIIQIISQSPQLVALIGDILFQNADFPGADEIMTRLRRMVPPQAMDDGPSANDQAMQSQIVQLRAVIEKMTQTLAEKSLTEKDHDAENDTRAYDAETKRIVAIGNSGPAISPEEIRPVLEQLLREIAGNGMTSAAA